MLPSILRKTFLFLLLALPLLAAAQPNPEADRVVGAWITKGNESHISIYRANNGKYYGKIAWLDVPNNPDGTPRTDKNNPDAKLRNRPALGLVILKDFEFDGDNVWNEGTIYDPNNGKTYSCKMTLTDANTLEIRGFIGISLLGRTEVWKRHNK